MHNNGVVLNAYDHEHEHFLMNTYHIPCGTYFSASCALMQCLIILHSVQKHMLVNQLPFCKLEKYTKNIYFCESPEP